jgi:hypothetical protein
MPASQTVTPRASGSATTAPSTPPPARRPVRSGGDPTARCQTARTARPSSSAPTTVRGRVSGWGSVRRRITATPSSTTGSTSAAAPITVRRPTSSPVPTGPPAPHHTPAAVSTASTTSARATPSRRWAASTSRARPTVRTSEPRPRAVSTHPPRSARTMGPGPVRRAGVRPRDVERPAGRRPFEPLAGGRCWGDRVSTPAAERRGVRPPVIGRLRDARLSGVSVRPAMGPR